MKTTNENPYDEFKNYYTRVFKVIDGLTYFSILLCLIALGTHIATFTFDAWYFFTIVAIGFALTKLAELIQFCDDRIKALNFTTDLFSAMDEAAGTVMNKNSENTDDKNI